MSHSFDKLVVKAFHGTPAADLVAQSPSALAGLSEADARALEAAFGVDTIRRLAELRFVERAQAILAAADRPSHDAGPSRTWSAFFADAPLAHYRGHASGRFRLEFGPVFYRGRLDGTARVLVVGQDPSVHELLAHRIFVGQSGQRVQGFLRKLGVTRSYVMLNTYLFPVYGQFDAELRAISLEPGVRDFRDGFLSRLAAESPIQVILAIGSAAQHAVRNWPGRGELPVLALTHPAAPNQQALLANWNEALAAASPLVEPDDGANADPTAYGNAFTEADVASVPSGDLPFGVPDWLGTGAHATRDGARKIVWEAG